MSESSKKPALEGIIGLFDDPQQLIRATEQVRDARYWSFDTYTPYPVHGLEQAQGLKRSPLPYFACLGGLIGFCAAFGLQYWTSVIDWPLIVGGKPFNSWPAFVPVLFELTVLLSGITIVLSLFALCRFPNTRRAVPDPSVTRDRFAIVIDAPPPIDPHADEEDRAARQKVLAPYKPFDESEVVSFLQKCGAKDVHKLYDEGWFN